MNEEEYIKCIRSSLNGPKVFLKRLPSETCVNAFNATVLLAWKANMDIQFVLDPYACAMYIVSYISKSQRGMSAMLDAAAKEARKGNLDLKKQVRHIGNIFSNAVEVSAQEAVYLVLQMPLTRCTRDVVFINTSPPEERVFLLKPKSVLEELPEDSTEIVSDNIVKRYAKRPRVLERWCLADYVSQLDVIYPKSDKLLNEDINEDDLDEKSVSDDDIDFAEDDTIVKLKNGIEIKRRKNYKVIRYVRYSKKSDPENHYRENMLLFSPWRNEHKDTMGGFETFKEHYISMKASVDDKFKQYEHNMEELELARQTAQEEFDAFDELAPNTQQAELDAEQEGETESESFVYFNPERPIEHRQYDIGIDIGASSSVPSTDSNTVLLSEENYFQLLRSLNMKQREFFNHVLHWMKTKEEPMYAFLSGGAGVGKSVLIKALYQALYRHLNLKDGENPDDIRILLCAFTGKAAFNINGVTIASAFKKKFKQSNQNMSCDELNTFRVKYRKLEVIIIDEISMVGNKMLTFIDQRLQQLTGTKRLFGGISIIAVGDLYQLMPVGDSWIFNDLTMCAASLAPNLWKENFEMYELVDIMRQKDDLYFAQFLNRLRRNELTNDDRLEIEKHIVQRDMENYPKKCSTSIHREQICRSL